MMPVECVYLFIRIYYKELFQVILEADKSRDVRLASWRPGRAEDAVSCTPESREEPRPQENPEGRKRTQCPSLKEVRQEDLALLWEASAFCSILAFNWLDEDHTHSGGQSSSVGSTYLNVKLI